MINRLTDSLDFQGQALALRAERQRVIASNIANADTPGYKARDFDFASTLRAATAGTNAGSALGPGEGIASDVMRSGSSPQPVLRYAVPTQTNLDSNTVDMDRERSAFVDNSVKYEATMRFMNIGLKTTLDALKSYHQS